VVRPDDIRPRLNAAGNQACAFDTPFRGDRQHGAAAWRRWKIPAMRRASTCWEVRAGNDKVGQRPVEVPAHSAQEVTFDFTVARRSRIAGCKAPCKLRRG